MSDPSCDAVAVLVGMLDDAFQRDAWHGPNLRASVRRVPYGEAIWRPAPEQRNIWEITLHAAYWKYCVWRRLTAAKRNSFPRKGSNWFARPCQGDAPGAWREDVALLDEMHARLRAAVEGLRPADLPSAPPGSNVTTAAIVSGIALHDVYHAGQIQQIRGIYAKAKREGRL